MIPDWWEMLLLSLAAFRVARLIGWDTISEPWRRRVTGLGDWKEGEPTPACYHGTLDEWLRCPWCQGFWVCLAWWGAWALWPYVTMSATVPFALSAIVGLVARRLDP